MPRVVRILVTSVGALLLVALVAALTLFVLGNRKLAQTHTPESSATFELAGSPQARSRGEHLVQAVLPCQECHGQNLGGTRFIDEPGFATIYASNLTKGQGGAARTYALSDWDRALRHGIAGDGRALAPMMPSEASQSLSDADLVAIVTYIESLPAVDSVTPKPSYGLMAKILVGAGLLPLAPDLVARTPKLSSVPEIAVTAEYGSYLAHVGGCMTCHGSDLRGAESPGEPGVQTPDLIATAATWNLDDFRQALRTGQTAQGTRIDETRMPWPYYARMTDAELAALHLYLQSLTSRASAD
jgi:cytochrome c553